MARQIFILEQWLKNTELQICSMQVLFFAAIIALCIVFLIYGTKFLLKIPGLTRALKTRTFERTTAEEIDQMAELRKAMLQIKLFAEIKRLEADQLSSAAPRLDSNLKALGDGMWATIKVCLDEEGRRNNQRFEQLNSKIAGFRENFDRVRDMRKRHEEFMDRLPRVPVTEVWTQTEYEEREGLEKDEAIGEQGPRRSNITVIKKALMEFLKEAKHQLSVQRNEVMLDLKSVFEQLSEDKENLKNTIKSVFSMATNQTQMSFLQVDNVGQDAMKCIAVLNENTERTLIKKFQGFSEKLQGILELMKNLNFDVSCTKQILENIDGQFDEIYKKLELECQKNADCSEEIVESLRATAQEWNEKSFSMEETCKQLTCATHGIKDMLAILDDVLCNRPAVSTDTILYSPSNAQSMLNRMPEVEYNKSALFMTVQSCQDKLAAMKDQIDQNTCEVQQSAELVLNELRILMTLVKNSVETLKNVTIKLPDSEDQLDKNYKHGDDMLDTISEITEESQDDFDMALHTKCISDITKKF